METGVFLEISLILVLATAIAGLTQLLRQPLIIGHILTGVLVGPSVLNLVHNTATIELFSHIGIALLLFIIGLGLNPKVIKEVGKVALITGLGQIIFTSVVGFALASLLGFEPLTALYMSLALTFSSTIIVLKLLSDKREQQRLYGKIATGFLLVQDVVAVLMLIVISASVGEGGSSGVVYATLGKGLLAIASLGAISIYILPRLASFFARSQEFLFLFSIGWGLGIAALFAEMGFSVEIGALAAGVALAGSTYSFQISSRMRPLRDFFIILFFIVLGSGLSFTNAGEVVLPALILSAYVLIGNPLIMMSLMGLMGYTNKVSFKAGLTVAQISEFSLVLILMGIRVGQVPAEVLSIITLVAIITIALSTYMVLYDDELYKKLKPLLKVFERKKLRSVAASPHSAHVILFGYKSGGYGFVKAFQSLGQSFLVIDYDPETISRLETRGIACLYGDANDMEFLEQLNLDKAKLVVVNLADHSTNALVTDRAKADSPEAIIIATANSDKAEEALDLYERGASYVLMPRYLGSAKLSSLLKRYNLSHTKFKAERTRHQEFLHAASQD